MTESEKYKFKTIDEAKDDLIKNRHTFTDPWVKYGPLRVLNHGNGIMKIGDSTRFFEPVWIRMGHKGKITIYPKTFFQRECELIAEEEIVVEEEVRVSWNVLIMDTDIHGIGNNPKENSPVRIKKRAWIGSHARILKGVTIGEAAIIACNSVVTSDIPDYAVAAGIPAKVIKILEPFEGKHGGRFEGKWYNPDFVPIPHPNYYVQELGGVKFDWKEDWNEKREKQ
ncbi:acyltransferase [bacterium]|nr:acyltransferase [Candidatus Omnitrophota bacterium]MBU2528383.1 acyltransferase [bacterium]MBU3930641.1 acyltransferase [bacterium]MBU4123402.1 acyltransferase [bacterium]